MGAGLVLADLKAPDAVAAELRAAGTTVEAHACDVTDRSDVNDLVAAAGAIDGAVAAAGILLDEHWEDERWDVEFDLTMGVNVRGTFHLARALLPGMKERGAGASCCSARAPARSAAPCQCRPTRSTRPESSR